MRARPHCSSCVCDVSETLAGVRPTDDRLNRFWLFVCWQVRLIHTAFQFPCPVYWLLSAQLSWHTENSVEQLWRNWSLMVLHRLTSYLWECWRGVTENEWNSHTSLVMLLFVTPPVPRISGIIHNISEHPQLHQRSIQAWSLQHISTLLSWRYEANLFHEWISFIIDKAGIAPRLHRPRFQSRIQQDISLKRTAVFDSAAKNEPKRTEKR